MKAHVWPLKSIIGVTLFALHQLSLACEPAPPPEYVIDKGSVFFKSYSSKEPVQISADAANFKKLSTSYAKDSTSFTSATRRIIKVYGDHRYA